MVGDFPPSTAWQDCDYVVPLFQTVFLAEKFPRHGGLHVSDERVADEFHGHAGIGVELFFERKDTQGLCEAAADQIHAPGAPGPELRANVIDVSNALGVELARQPQM